VSDPRPQGTDKPLLKPVGVSSFVRPAPCERPALTIESFLLFAPPVELDGLDTGLCTTGFDGVDVPAPEIEPASPPTAAPIEINIPERPILEVRPSATPIAVYEPIQFLDYEDEEEDSFGFVQAEPEPESDPEPPVLTEFAALDVLQPAAPAPAKFQQGFGTIALPDVPVELPESSLQTARPRILRGRNPSAPKTKPVPEVKPTSVPVLKQAPVVTKAPPAPQRPASTFVQRPAAAATAPAVEAEPTVQGEKDKRPSKTTQPPPNRPVRDRGNAVPVEEVIPDAPVPSLKPKMVPIRKPEPLAPAAVIADGPMLGLPQEEGLSRPKLAMVAAVVVTLAVGGYFVFSGGKTSAAASAESTSETALPGMVIGGGGWTTTWGADTPTNRGKQISIYRPSMTMPDYRFEFRGQIERKALGWIFRASNPKNYYVMKLETIKPGANPLVALVKYAVIDGKETTRTQVMLPVEVKTNTVYQVRLDVSGDKFTTYVQGKLVDYWTDSRIKLGGTGFYTETGERSQIKSSQVSYAR
jgi:hypothetical protein